MPLPLSGSAAICLRRCRGGSQTRPFPWAVTPVGRDDSARRLTGFRPLGEFLFSRRKRNQNAAGGDSHRRREQVPSGSSSFSPGPPFTGDTPIPSCNISGAQNMVPGMIPPGPLGPGAAQNFGLCHFTAAPRFDQPWQRVRDRGCAGRGRSHGAGTGGHRGPPLRGNRENVLQQGTGGHRGSPALCGP